MRHSNLNVAGISHNLKLNSPHKIVQNCELKIFRIQKLPIGDYFEPSSELWFKTCWGFEEFTDIIRESEFRKLLNDQLSIRMVNFRPLWAIETGNPTKDNAVAFGKAQSEIYEGGSSRNFANFRFKDTKSEACSGRGTVRFQHFATDLSGCSTSTCLSQ